MALKRLAPILTTDDMDRSVRFYVEVLGFTCGTQAPGYSNLYRDAVRIMLAAPNKHLEWKARVSPASSISIWRRPKRWMRYGRRSKTAPRSSMRSAISTMECVSSASVTTTATIWRSARHRRQPGLGSAFELRARGCRRVALRWGPGFAASGAVRHFQEMACRAAGDAQSIGRWTRTRTAR